MPAAAAASRGACSPLLFFMVPWVVLSTFNVGFGISELNPLQRVLTCRGPAPTGWLPACFALSEAGFGILTALFTLGGLVSSLLLSPLRARFGLTKRATLLAAAVVGAAGAALQGFAWSVAALGAGRALMGMGAGVGVAVVPGYLNDISPPALRGPIGVANQLSIVLGILLAQALGVSPLGSAPAEASTPTHGGFARWRFVPLFSLGVQLLQLLGASLACESPAEAPPHRQAELRARLGADVHGEGAAEEEEALLPAENGGAAPTGEALEIPALLRITLRGGKDVRERETRRGVVLIMGTLVAQQLSGVNAVLYFSSSIMADALGGGDNERNAKLIALGITVVNALMTFPPMYLISESRLGRRGLLLSSSSSMALSSLALGLGILYAVPWLSAVALVSVVAGFSIGLGPVPFLILPELVEPRAASAAASLGISLNWAANLAIASLFLPLRSWCARHDGGSGGSIFFLFAAINAVTTTFVARLYRYAPPSPRRE